MGKNNVQNSTQAEAMKVAVQTRLMSDLAEEKPCFQD